MWIIFRSFCMIGTSVMKELNLTTDLSEERTNSFLLFPKKYQTFPTLRQLTSMLVHKKRKTTIQNSQENFYFQFKSLQNTSTRVSFFFISNAFFPLSLSVGYLFHKYSFECCLVLASHITIIIPRHIYLIYLCLGLGLFMSYFCDLCIKDFFSKCDQVCNFLRIWSQLLKKSLMENFIFCAVRTCFFVHFLEYLLLFLNYNDADNFSI